MTNTTQYWSGTIAELTARRDANSARIQKMTERRRGLALDCQLDPAGPERKESDIIAKDLAALGGAAAELTFAIEQAGQHLAAAQQTERDVSARELEQRCKEISGRVVSAAAEFDTACGVLAAAADKVKATMQELTTAAPGVAQTLFVKGPFTRAARRAGLQAHLDLEPARTPNIDSLEQVAASVVATKEK